MKTETFNLHLLILPKIPTILLFCCRITCKSCIYGHSCLKYVLRIFEILPNLFSFVFAPLKGNMQCNVSSQLWLVLHNSESIATWPSKHPPLRTKDVIYAWKVSKGIDPNGVPEISSTHSKFRSKFRVAARNFDRDLDRNFEWLLERSIHCKKCLSDFNFEFRFEAKLKFMMSVKCLKVRQTLRHFDWKFDRHFDLESSVNQ